MFENIRKCLDDYEKSTEDFYTDYDYTVEDREIIDYFEMNFAKAIMKDLRIYKNDEKIAKIILAAKGLSNEIKVKVE